ncbi:MAG: hypothetical protein WCG25_05375 [bacterium]
MTILSNNSSSSSFGVLIRTALFLYHCSFCHSDNVTCHSFKFSTLIQAFIIFSYNHHEGDVMVCIGVNKLVSKTSNQFLYNISYNCLFTLLLY